VIPVVAYIKLNISALRHNIAKVREYAPHSKLMAVIKANAYGHGVLDIARYLSDDVNAFAVARLDEALQLRQHSISGRLLVLSGFSCAEELSSIQQYQIEVVVHSKVQIEILEAAKLSEPIRVWLKVDTGMNRLGIKSTCFSETLSRLQACSNVHKEINFMTHFANADDMNNKDTQQQLALFKQTVGGESGELSCANSAAIIAWPETRLDWVRPGLMLYGVTPLLTSTAEALGLLPVMSLYARIIAIKSVEIGASVGYGSTWVAKKNTLLGVVSVGYGDGYPRYVKTGTPVLVNGLQVPLVGRVSMDMLTIDLSNLTSVAVGDEVMLWGDGLPIEEVALCADTIPYTLLCGITQRVQVQQVNIGLNK